MHSCVCIDTSRQLDSWMWFRQASYEAVFDPLDGSRNIDAGIPTGTIFGIYRSPGQSHPQLIHDSYKPLGSDT